MPYPAGAMLPTHTREKGQPARRRARGVRAARERGNRIFELSQAKGLTYAQIADHCGVSERTIMRLANAKAERLNIQWMKKLAKVFGVEPEALQARPVSDALRKVRVQGTLRAGAWAESYEWPPDEHYDVMIPDDPDLRDAALYAAEVAGTSMNLRYQPGSVAVMSKITQRPNEITEGRRYHVQIARVDGTVEDTIKTLTSDRDGKYWLKPESDDPAHQEWIPLEGKPGENVRVVGRVRYVVIREP